MWPRPGCAAQLTMGTGPAELTPGLVLPPAPPPQPLPGNVLGKPKQALILGSREYSHESRNGDTHSHRIPVRPDVPCSFHPFSTLPPPSLLRPKSAPKPFP
jgi:hypothetical protein